MSATTARENAVSLARHDPKAAYARAKKIADPWFCCQALAWVAWSTPDDVTFKRIVAEAIAMAQTAADPYRRVGGCAWPVRALVERHHGAEAVAEVRKALGVAPQIENPVSRADALFLLFQAVLPAGAKASQHVVSALLAACSAADSWMRPQILRDVALMLAADDMAAAKKIVSVLQDGRERRQAERGIAEGRFITPRAFFWTNPSGPI